jgi:hypothetical protein
MKWLFRPSILVLLSGLLAIGAATLVLWPRPYGIKVAPVGDSDREVVWLYTATEAETWERLVAGVVRATNQLQQEHPDLTVTIDDRTFPRQSTSWAELSLAVRHGRVRLILRWYKLTSDQNTSQWIDALCEESRRPPLAIIGGSSSNSAVELAKSLQKRVRDGGLAAPPLLLLTTATADQAQFDDGSLVALTDIYAGRTLRFCFTNQQMATAVTHFLWHRDELRPDADLVYQVYWLDSAYSMDLAERFGDALRSPLTARALAQEWGWLGGAGSTAAFPLNLAGVETGHFAFPIVERIDFTVGGITEPNRWEAPVVRRLMETKTGQYPGQRLPLLVLSAPSWQPARRFLHGLARFAPIEARRFVVATGDALGFESIYRDRKAAWPIQDLPFNLVFFCHRNPVDVAGGFLAEGDPRSADLLPGKAGTGTEDLLLFTDIVETLVHAAYQGEKVPTNGDDLARRLREIRWNDGQVSLGEEGPHLFDDHGNRRSNTGEHIVWLRPVLQKERVLPQATIEVWLGEASSTEGISWLRQRVLAVDYDEGATESEPRP